MAKRSGFLNKEAPQNVCGPRIRELRRRAKGDKGRHRSIEEMAALIENEGVSMSYSQLSKIERRQKHVLDVQLVAIARVLGVRVCDLFPEGGGRGEEG